MIIIPDVHGRTFWKEAVKGRENEEIIFLGDYVDPYVYEGIMPEDGILALEDIIKFKQDHPNNVHLLLGNHDAGYIWESVCSARRSKKYYGDISHLFTSNLEKFDLVYKKEINGKKYLFSHAPVHKIWIDKFIEGGYTDTFRHFVSDGGHYTWWDYKTGARKRNVGWRIDYFFIDTPSVSKLKSAGMLSEVMGSDHCPIELTADL